MALSFSKITRTHSMSLSQTRSSPLGKKLLIHRSDPEGPAETLFQQPYFQLLSDALREGGVITTQGPFHLIKQLTSSRMPMAPSRHHERSQESMSKRLPRRRIRIYHYPHVPPSRKLLLSQIPFGPDWVHGVLQGCLERCICATSIVG